MWVQVCVDGFRVPHIVFSHLVPFFLIQHVWPLVSLLWRVLSALVKYASLPPVLRKVSIGYGPFVMAVNGLRKPTSKSKIKTKNFTAKAYLRVQTHDPAQCVQHL